MTVDSSKNRREFGPSFSMTVVLPGRYISSLPNGMHFRRNADLLNIWCKSFSSSKGHLEEREQFRRVRMYRAVVLGASTSILVDLKEDARLVVGSTSK
jgi:hypothetical protein